MLSTSSPLDAQEAWEWAMAKAQDYVVPLEDLEGASFLKVDGVFYAPVKPALYMGPLIHKPDVDWKAMGRALLRSVREVRKTFTGDIIYLNRSHNEVDDLMERAGFEPVEAKLMRLRGKDVLRAE